MDKPLDPAEPSADVAKDTHVIKMSPEQQDRDRKFFAEQAQQLVKLRSKNREFHGLEREFLYAQTEMLQQYEKSKDIKHPRDVGNTREAILGRFLETSGYLPAKYSISSTSVRVASTQGFVSREIDILLFDNATSIVLISAKTNTRFTQQSPHLVRSKSNQSSRRWS